MIKTVNSLIPLKSLQFTLSICSLSWLHTSPWSWQGPYYHCYKEFFFLHVFPLYFIIFFSGPIATTWTSDNSSISRLSLCHSCKFNSRQRPFLVSFHTQQLCWKYNSKTAYIALSSKYISGEISWKASWCSATHTLQLQSNFSSDKATTFFFFFWKHEGELWLI